MTFERHLHVHVHVGRHHLRKIPPIIGTLVALMVIGPGEGAAALLSFAATFVGLAVIFAAVDQGITRVRDWREDVRLAQSVEIHPAHAATPEPPLPRRLWTLFILFYHDIFDPIPEPSKKVTRMARTSTSPPAAT